MINRRLVAIALLTWSLQVGATDFVKDLTSAAGPVQIATFKASLDKKAAAQKMAIDERVACVGMGRRQCSEMITEDSIRGPNYSSVTPTAPALAESKAKGRAAYDAWIAGKKPEQLAEAKKLYAAWLTYIDTVYQVDASKDISQTPAGVAYTQAVNEFQIDNPG